MSERNIKNICDVWASLNYKQSSREIYDKRINHLTGFSKIASTLFCFSNLSSCNWPSDLAIDVSNQNITKILKPVWVLLARKEEKALVEVNMTRHVRLCVYRIKLSFL